MGEVRGCTIVLEGDDGEMFLLCNERRCFSIIYCVAEAGLSYTCLLASVP